LTDFAINLFKNVSAKDDTKNQAISPLSIALGLALLESGADGKTRKEIKQVLLKDKATREDVLNVYVNLEEQLKIKQGKVQLSVANGLFQDKDLKLKDDFSALIKNCLIRSRSSRFQSSTRTSTSKSQSIHFAKNQTKNTRIIQTRRFDHR